MQVFKCELPCISPTPDGAHPVTELCFRDASLDAPLIQLYAAALPNLKRLVVSKMRPCMGDLPCPFEEVTVLRPEKCQYLKGSRFIIGPLNWRLW